MPSFSQRYGYKPASKAIQRESLDQDTRNQLWNVISPFLQKHGLLCSVLQDVWTDYFKETHDTCPSVTGVRKDHDCFYWFYKEYFLTNAKWHECFDLMEFLVNPSRQDYWRNEIYNNAYIRADQCNLPTCELINFILERECCAYRFVEYQTVEITSAEEIEAIEEACQTLHDATGKHIQNALALLSNRKNPDYPNSVKESISAVEALCQKITGDKKATLGKALDLLQKQTTPLHPALLAAFDKLYGYTSAAGGIRHGSIDIAKVDYHLAKFMLVTCSAFVNYVQSTMS